MTDKQVFSLSTYTQDHNGPQQPLWCQSEFPLSPSKKRSGDQLRLSSLVSLPTPSHFFYDQQTLQRRLPSSIIIPPC